MSSTGSEKKKKKKRDGSTSQSSMSGTLHSIDTCHTEAAHKFLIKKDLSGTNKRQALLLYSIYYGLVQVQRGYIFFSHMMRVQKATEKNLHRAFNQGAAILRAGNIGADIFIPVALWAMLFQKKKWSLCLSFHLTIDLVVNWYQWGFNTNHHGNHHNRIRKRPACHGSPRR